MSRKVILIGGGGHALSVLEMQTAPSLFAGYADLQPSEAMPIQYLGTDEEILSAYSPDDYNIHVSFVYAGEVNLQMRAKLIERYAAYHAHTLIATTAVVTPNTTLGKGTAIFHRAVVNRSELGKHVVVNTGAIIEHNCHIGNDVFVGPGAVICGGVTIGDNTLIGAGSIVRDDVSIPANTVVGIGSVVTKDLKNNGVYLGSPARLISKLKI